MDLTLRDLDGYTIEELNKKLERARGDSSSSMERRNQRVGTIETKIRLKEEALAEFKGRELEYRGR